MLWQGLTIRWVNRQGPFDARVASEGLEEVKSFGGKLVRRKDARRCGRARGKLRSSEGCHALSVVRRMGLSEAGRRQGIAVCDGALDRRPKMPFDARLRRPAFHSITW
eukprot:scaffold172_cov341-Pavlova_lutheri.AAC.19